LLHSRIFGNGISFLLRNPVAYTKAHLLIHSFINAHKAAVIIKYKKYTKYNEQKNIENIIKYKNKNSNKSSTNRTYNK